MLKNNICVNNLFMNNKNLDDSLNKICGQVIKTDDSELKINMRSNVFETVYFDDLVLKNRLCYISESDQKFLNTSNSVDETIFDFYTNIAKTGVGTIFTGGFKMIPTDENKLKVEKYLKLNREKIINFVSQVHTFGAKIFYSLNSAFGRADSKNNVLGLFNYSASYNINFNNSHFICKKISDKKCNKIIDLMANQAYLALQNNFDGIVINGDLFGIVGEFSSPELNRRKLGYYIELYDFTKKLVGKILQKNSSAKIIYKFTLTSMIREIYGESKVKIKSLKYFYSNFDLSQIFDILKQFVGFGVDGFIIKLGTFESEFLSVSTAFQNDNILKNIYLELIDYFKSNEIKNKFGNQVIFIYEDFLYDIPNDINNENILYNFSRQILADNCVINKLKNNLQIRNCIKCGLCESKNNCFMKNDWILNPQKYYKDLITNNANLIEKICKNDDFELNNSENDDKIAVIGAGISGINVAINLLKIGYKVDLYEKEKQVNKIGRCCEIYGYNYLLKNYNDYIENELYDFIKKDRLKLYLDTEFKISMLNDNNYSKIVVSTGFKTKFSTIPGAVLPNVKNIYEVLSNKYYFENKKKIIIEAKSELSLALAQYLLLNNKNVTLLLSDLKFLNKMENSVLTYYLLNSLS